MAISTSNGSAGTQNRLADSTSPYLLQHAQNPVDWYTWGEEAFNKSRHEDKPIFLSIGYSACHWCHVMAHESFENNEIAAYLNEHFVSIKVDREQHPDVDEIFMTAVQMMTGSGGWPLTVFLTPDLKPFFGGTYFPPEERYGRIGFLHLLAQIHEVYTNRRDQVEHSADRILEVIGRYNSSITNRSDYDRSIVDNAVRVLRKEFDPRWGGFGSAPKFPPTAQIDLLLKVFHRTGQSDLLQMVELTLKKMIEGGLFDQLGGGFHRYSTDDRWLIPHFEKMLYDNALMAIALLDGYLVTAKDEFAVSARKILDWMLRDMSDEAGGFHSSLDADSDGEEGLFYLWKKDEIQSILGNEDGALFCDLYDVSELGNFENNSNILHLKHSLDTTAERLSVDPISLRLKLESMHDKLLIARNERITPAKDDKVLTDWNGLAISALSRGYRVLGDEKYLIAAEQAADFVWSNMWKGGSLLHSFRKGEAEIDGLLDDYAFILNGFIDLYQAGFDIEHIRRAIRIAERMIELFWDFENSGFYLVPVGRTDLIGRSRHNRDGAVPSGNAIAGEALLKLHQLIDRVDFLNYADKLVKAFAAQAADHPEGYLRTIALMEVLLSPRKQIAVIGNGEAPHLFDLLKVVNSVYMPELIVAYGESAEHSELALLQDRVALNGKPTAYYCHDFTCERPVIDPVELREMISKLC